MSAATEAERDLAHEAEIKARAIWLQGADLDDGDPDEDWEEEPMCDRCNGDGRDPWNDYLLPCPECDGEQRL